MPNCYAELARSGRLVVNPQGPVSGNHPSALQPDKWPRESSGKFIQVTEVFASVRRGSS